MTDTVSDGRLLDELRGLAADQRLSTLCAYGPPEPLLIKLGDEVDRRAKAEVADAIAAGELTVDLADQFKLPSAQARSRRALASALAHAGRFAEALALGEEAYRLAYDAGYEVEAARVQLATAHALSGLSRFDEAIAAGQAAYRALLTANERHLAARADISLGALHDLRDDPATALAHYDRARPFVVDDPALVAQLEVNRGVALMALDDFAAAEAAFTAAVRVFEHADLPWAAAIAEGNLAYLALRQGRLEAAFRSFERARRSLERDVSQGHLARLLAEQAEALAVLGLPEDAVTTLERAVVDLEGLGCAAEAAQARAGLGRALVRLGRDEDAERVLVAAAVALDNLKLPIARARVDLVRAEIAANRGRLDEAQALVSDALDVLQDRPTETMAARLQLARMALAARNLAMAETELDLALPIAEQYGLAPFLADLLHVRGLLRRAQGRSSLAMADLGEAVAHVERVRGTLQAERFRTAFLGNRLAVYQDFVVQALDRGDAEAVAAAFAGVEQAKSRALLDLVSGAIDLSGESKGNGRNRDEAAILSRLAQLRAALNWRYSQRVDEDRKQSRADMAVWQKEIERHERDLMLLEDRLAAVRGVAGLYTTPLDLEEIQGLIPADAALVEYFVAHGKLLAFVLCAGNVWVARDLVSLTELTELIRRFHFQIGRAVSVDFDKGGKRAGRLLADVRRELAALHARVLAPLLPAIGSARRLIVIPHGPLHTVPFQALWNGDQYLIERRELHYVPSASLLAHLRSRDHEMVQQRAALVVGVTDAAAPQIAHEAARVAQTLKADTRLLDGAATVERVCAEAHRASIVHLACHGRFTAQRPLASGLRLADRWLTVRDIFDLRLQADLITLSGCDTGRAVVTNGDELVGLIRGLFAAGASSLLVSLWTVNDGSTAELMTRFYETWQAGASKTAALRTAQLASLEQHAHPAFWAPFILGGNA